MLQKLLTLTILTFLGTAAQAAELVMVEQHGCFYCEKWNAEIAPIYPKTAEGLAAPLRRMDLQDDFPGEIAFKAAVVFTPTFVLVENGEELARLEGYPGEDFFWGLLNRLLAENTGFEDSS